MFHNHEIDEIVCVCLCLYVLNEVYQMTGVKSRSLFFSFLNGVNEHNLCGGRIMGPGVGGPIYKRRGF